LKTGVIVPVFGEKYLTDAVLSDLREDGAASDIIIVDNGGDYEAADGELVIRPGHNLRWAAGSNLGLRTSSSRGNSIHIVLNNDTRLSRKFTSSLLAAYTATGANLLAPVYDRNWPQQRTAFSGFAHDYSPLERETLVPFVDGTCLVIPEATLRSIGFLDDQSWPKYEWGCDKDYALRIRQAGGSVWVTERAYINHIGRQTAVRQPQYDEREAEDENNAGMAAKWGVKWRDLLYAGFDQVSRKGLVQERLERRS